MKYEVSQWSVINGEHRYISHYCGNNLLIGIFVLLKLKLEGEKCAKLEWR
jgi:hypothetical protein